MIFKRFLEQQLLEWFQSTQRKPVLLRGARQVGKSSLIEDFAQRHFENVLTVNFELEPALKKCFASLKPDEICNALRVMTKQPIESGKTLLFLDEIQDCPEAIQSLRYFKELMPELHVIGAGSLLELALQQAQFRMPVGRVSFLYLYPLSFSEVLQQVNPVAMEQITQADITKPINIAIHDYLLTQLRQYIFLGGMPEVCSNYFETENVSEIARIQADILATYQSDFGHYAKVAQLPYLNVCFARIPLMVGQQIKYKKIDPDLRSRELKQALETLELAAILHRVQATSATGLPLEATVNEKKFKMNFIDVGLVTRVNQLETQVMLNEDIMLLNQGGLVEQFVGQELLAHARTYERAKNYFWARDDRGTAEVDYIIVIDGKIFPLEVKAGKLGKLKSLQQFVKDHDCPFGIRVAKCELEFDEERKVLSVPLYMLSELERLVRGLYQARCS